MHLRGARPRKYCNLHIKLNMFNKRFKNEAPKKHQTMTQKSTNKKALDPSKWSSRRDETLGFEKSRFLQTKTENNKNVLFLCWGLVPRTLRFTKDSYDFMNKKRCTFWGHFSSIWEPHVAKTICFMMVFDDFWCFVWAPKKCQKNARRSAKMAPSRPVWVQLVPDRTHPFAHVR